MRTLCLFLSLALALGGRGQTLRGRVIDGQTKQGLPYANVGIRGKSIGGITDQTGAFSIDISNANTADTLVVSYVGYRSFMVPVRALPAGPSQVFYLTAVPRMLDEVVITDRQDYIIFGNDGKSNRHTGWGDFTSAAGRAVGLQIPAPNMPVKINSVFFHLHENGFDSVRLRVNLLHVTPGGIVPISGQNTNVIFTTSQRKGWVKVALPEALVFNMQDLVVAIEWLEAWGKPRTMDEGGSYLFTITLGRWPGLHYRREKPEEVPQLTSDNLTPSIYLECLAIKR
jgi:hypothetical protein